MEAFSRRELITNPSEEEVLRKHASRASSAFREHHNCFSRIPPQNDSATALYVSQINGSKPLPALASKRSFREYPPSFPAPVDDPSALHMYQHAPRGLQFALLSLYATAHPNNFQQTNNTASYDVGPRRKVYVRVHPAREDTEISGGGYLTCQSEI
ncbi:hypothetical protein BDZ45DRAFT_748367 [Acephala macrosclerotiorum]|nr:hypothetical protein BDZ45DRAFT_748367 [Acephala macrosclerotiorum]